MKMEQSEATKFFSDFFGGEHHIPGKLQQYGEGWSVICGGALSSYDSDSLTRLVLMAHSRAIRVEVSGASKKIRIAIHKRDLHGQSMYERHPNTALWDNSAIVQVGIR